MISRALSRRALMRTLALGLGAGPWLLRSAGSRAETAGPRLRVALLVPALAADNPFSAIAVRAAERLVAAGEIELEVRERMADPINAEKVLRRYATLGQDLIIGHGIELAEPTLRVAAAFPRTHFATSGGSDLKGHLAANVDGWTYDFGELGYLCGWLAARIGGVARVGAVGGPDLPFVRLSHAGFKAGLAETRPDVPVLEVYTGSFDDVQKAVEATRGLIARGAQLIWTSGDGIGNGVAAAANAAHVPTIGVSGSAGGLAALVNVATVEVDLLPTYRVYVQEIRAGRFGGVFHTSGIANRGLVFTPIRRITPGVPAALDEQVERLVREVGSGTHRLPPAALPAT
jgi:basic membrane lipoprotein Med (substrate-binding protein (PBP1-ABC) superfamily)